METYTAGGRDTDRPAQSSGEGGHWGRRPTLTALTRRGFLTRALCSLALGTVSVPALRAAAEAAEDAGSGGENAGLSPSQWEMMARVHEHLLPSEPDSPGAREIHATGYLRLVLSEQRVQPADRELIHAGVVELHDLCVDLYGCCFAALDTDRREAALRKLESSERGSRWLGEILEFLMEALVGDPSHGGNPDGIAWQWLGITPGFPRPPLGQREPR